MALQFYESLPVWRRLLRLVEHVYALTARFPESEKSGMTATLRRSITATSAKVAEAAAREDASAAAAGLEAAATALIEIDAHLLIAHRLGYVSRWRTGRLRRRLDHLHHELAALAQTWREEQDPPGGQTSDEPGLPRLAA